MDVRKGVVMDSLKYHWGPPYLTPLCLMGYRRAVSGVAAPTLVFYPLGYPTLYSPDCGELPLSSLPVLEESSPRLLLR
jgi:hypothetical protein